MPYLFPVKLRGVGTMDVEALSSYTLRLAIAHTVSIDTLVERLRLGYLRDHPDAGEKPLSGVRSSRPCVLVRPNRSTLQLEQLLAYATGQDNLRCGTFLALGDVIRRPSLAFAETMRWCPVCMLEFLHDGDTGYFKLLWHLEDVTHCPVHNVRLRDRCYRCKSLQNSTARRRDCTTCVYCGEPLGRRSQWQDLRDRWKNQGADLIGIVEEIAKDPQLCFPASAMQSMLLHPAAAKLIYGPSVIEDDLYVANESPRFLAWKSARRAAYKLGIGLTDLLSGNIDAVTRPLEPSWAETPPDDMQPKLRAVVHDHKKILRRLKRVASAGGPKNPPSLKALARQFGVSVGYLQYQFPDLAHAVIERHRAWSEGRRWRRRLEARAAALAHFTKERYVLESGSKKGVLRTLREETGLPKNLLREEIDAVWQALQTLRAPGGGANALGPSEPCAHSQSPEPAAGAK